jgi:hypothetical protein
LAGKAAPPSVQVEENAVGTSPLLLLHEAPLHTSSLVPASVLTLVRKGMRVIRIVCNL